MGATFPYFRNQFFLALLLLLSSITPLQAGSRDFLVYVTRLGGDAALAKPYLDKFSAYVEEVMGWPKGSVHGYFFVDKEQALAAMKELKPGLSVLEPPLFFELRQSDQLSPLVQLESRELNSARLNLGVADPALTMIEQLKGKQLWTTLANSPEYLGRVVLNSQTELAGSLTLKKINQVLKGIRAVLRGEAAATLLDDEQLELARKMEGGDKLRAIYTSPHLPCLPVAVATAQITAKEQAALVKALLGMCSTEKGQETCKLMHIEKFVPVQSDIYQETQKRFEKP